ncbi:hypothetical protein PL75_10285 [Neisseria arctica]|uniref:Uncharacterized protein n=1 Tax=Neisseria arctica TaxID=1470200 RepID=A0A0J0YPJ8_9NEIS|nr:hypothetical protein [Neisseria arctica]KLT72065.1 hypothetical protein PL75_10285 [Neisseria arctica]UOO87323.1 hypothetical protein LVJ86_03450 [Neisseria arctica]
MTWKTHSSESEAHYNESELEVLMQKLLSWVTLLDMAHSFIVFEEIKHKGNSGIITVKKKSKNSGLLSVLYGDCAVIGLNIK